MIKINYKFATWLSNNPKGWSRATVQKYESAIRAISNDMIGIGTISKSLYDMSLIELDAAIVIILNDEFFINKDNVGKKMYSNALKQYRAYMVSNIDAFKNDADIVKLEQEILNDESIPITERETIVEARVGQGRFRKQLIDKYGKCLITGVDNPRLLVASHIKPWTQSDSHDKLSVYNGLLLTPTFDKLFDNGFITFSENGKLLVSSFVGKENECRLYIPTGNIFSLPDVTDFKKNMEYHRDILFVK